MAGIYQESFERGIRIMALRAIMLRSKIDKKNKELDELRKKDADFAIREKELETAIDEAQTEEEQQTVSDAVDAFDEEKKEHEAAKSNLQSEINDLELELEKTEKELAEPANRSAEKRSNTERMERTMAKHDIRSLPMNVRAFDSLSREQKNAIIEREDVKEFLIRMREQKGSKRAISGGDLEIPVVFMEIIAENMYRYSKLLNRVRTRPVGGEARQTIAGTVPEAIWTEMCGAINELSFVFHQITLDGYKVSGYVPICNSLLEDTTSNLDLASWIIEMLSESIGYAIDKAILYGKGANAKMPLGIVTRLAQDSKPSGYPANAPEWVDLSDTNIIKIDGASLEPIPFLSAFAIAAGNTYTRYARGDKFWAMNSKTYAQIQAKLISATATGEFVSRIAGVMPITAGNVDILEFIPDGDIIGGYGELYLWIERGTMQMDLSPHVQFIQDNTVFRGKSRADGQPVIPGAFVAININNHEVTTVMDFAADTANDADLESLVIGSESLNPAFDSDTLTYHIASASEASAKIEATAAQANASIEISYNGKNVANNGTVKFIADSTAHELTVTVKNGNAVKVYTVNITKGE